MDEDGAMGFAELWEALLPVGRQPGGGYRRYSWTGADQECRSWFLAAAGERGLRAETDRNGNLWAWWEPPGTEGQPAVVTGSHLDSVPDGGAFDGPLGVVSGFAAIDQLRGPGAWPRPGRSRWPRSPRRRGPGSGWPAWAPGWSPVR